MIALFKKAAKVGLKAYLASWLFLLWSAFCILIGAGWMYLSIVAVLRAKGLM